MFTLPTTSNRISVEVMGREYHVMLLPVFSLSAPAGNYQRGYQRMVFDWGKSLSHPHADIAIAFMKPWGMHIIKVIYKGHVYEIRKISKCRSGRKAAHVMSWGLPSSFDNMVVEKALATEFPHKTTV